MPKLQRSSQVVKAYCVFQRKKHFIFSCDVLLPCRENETSSPRKHNPTYAIIIRKQRSPGIKQIGVGFLRKVWQSTNFCNKILKAVDLNEIRLSNLQSGPLMPHYPWTKGDDRERHDSSAAIGRCEILNI